MEDFLEEVATEQKLNGREGASHREDLGKEQVGGNSKVQRPRGVRNAKEAGVREMERWGCSMCHEVREVFRGRIMWGLVAGRSPGGTSIICDCSGKPHTETFQQRSDII